MALKTHRLQDAIRSALAVSAIAAIGTGHAFAQTSEPTDDVEEL